MLALVVRKNGTVRRPIAVLAAVLALSLTFSGCAQECLDEPIPETFTTWTVRGEVTESEVLIDEWSTNVNLITMQTAEGVEQFELTGKPELIEVGRAYEAELYIDPESPNSTGTGTAALFGPEGCGGFKNTIQVFDPDQSTADELVFVPIGIPSPVPESPISLRQFLTGFGVFAFVLFVFRHR